MNLRELKSRGIELTNGLGHRISDRWKQDAALRHSSINVGKPERVVSGVLGSALVLLGMRRPGTANRLVSLAGADLIFRAACGHCNIYKALNISTVSPEEQNLRRLATEPRLSRRPAA